ncbi:MAG: hypothetical protein AAF525_21870 [Pseudomonadota bacterium]
MPEENGAGFNISGGSKRWLQYGLVIGLAAFFLSLLVLEPPDRFDVPCSMGVNERYERVQMALQDLSRQSSAGSATVDDWIHGVNTRVLRSDRCGLTIGPSEDHVSGRIGLELTHVGDTLEFVLTVPGSRPELTERRLMVIAQTTDTPDPQMKE